MADSDVDIVNQGLIHLGERRISSLSGGTRRQEVISELYEPTRRALLSEITWRFATHTQELAQRILAPDNTRYTYAYSLPTSPKFLRAQYINPAADYAIEGNLLLTSASSVLLTYTADADESVMLPYFSYLLGLRMAWAMAMPLTKDLDREQAMQKKYESYLPTARYADSGQQPNEPVSDAPFINCRG